MVKLLDGSELAGYIKERQARQVRMLRQAHKIFPKLVIITSENTSPVIDTYVRMKRRYGDDILIETEVVKCRESKMIEAIEKYNADDTVHGIIVQLPLEDVVKTDEILATIASKKDVDGLGQGAQYLSATAEAIQWLLAGYGVDLAGKKIAIIGNGRLVGAPLARSWQESGLTVTVIDETTTEQLDATVKTSDIIVSATGVPRLITSQMIPTGAVVVDAGTASEDGKLVGDVEPAARERDDLKITPEKGGVGPLTIAALYDHIIQAALAQVPQK